MSLHLRLGNLQFGLELGGLRHFRKNGARRHALSHFNRHFLHHAIDAGADIQVIRLLALQFVIALGLVDGHFLSNRSAL